MEEPTKPKASQKPTLGEVYSSHLSSSDYPLLVSSSVFPKFQIKFEPKSVPAEPETFFQIFKSRRR